MTLVYPSRRIGSGLCTGPSSQLLHGSSEGSYHLNKSSSYDDLTFHLDDDMPRKDHIEDDDDDLSWGESNGYQEFRSLRSILKTSPGIEDYLDYYVTTDSCDDSSFGTAQSDKSVTFADDNDLSLEEIRTYTPTPVMYMLSPDLTNFHFLKSPRNTKSLSVLPTPTWKPDISIKFKQPFLEKTFKKKLSSTYVSLEKCDTRNRLLQGLVLVKNVAYEKLVMIRYTIDDWKTNSDAESIYLSPAEDEFTDRFTFTLNLPVRCRAMEFAVCFRTPAQEFWDNNEGKNYRVEEVP